jgi:hypothetical protein
LDGTFDVADAFSVDDADFENAFDAAGLQVIGNQVAEVGGAEGVEVEFGGDGQFDGVGFGIVGEAHT